VRVRVRLIVDAVGSFGLGRDYFAELVAAGGAIRWFKELRLASFSFRDHRKLLVVDESLACVGGCNIAPEYDGDGITALHAKLIVVDDIVFVGSSNLDPRSLRINFELMLRIQNAALATTARQQFESDLAQRAIPISRDALQQGRSWWERLKQRLSYWLFARLDPEVAALKLQRWRFRKDRLVQRVQRIRRGRASPVE
jgi:phosphatidylserine/phosphatidylglycerophosphate/cardiolipin synthase-like enzyme